MRTKKDQHIDLITREAWEENWSDISIEGVLEIFSYPRVQKQIEIYKAYLPRDKKILEGGCGLGPYLIYFKEQGYDIVGIDYNQRPLAKLSGYNSTLPVCCADVLNIPFPDSYFGAYLSLGVIEHFTEGPGLAVKEACRVLAPEGYFLVQVPRFSIFHKIKYPLTLLKKSKSLRRIFRKTARRHYWEQYFGVSELARILKNNGFEIIRIIPTGHEHALLTFCGLFRDRGSYDGASRLAVAIGDICQRYMPWSTAAEMILICRKK